MPMSWCHSHNTEEPITDATYRICSECGHVYERGRDLVEAHNDAMAETIDETDQFLSVYEANEIESCPTCGHDW